MLDNYKIGNRIALLRREKGYTGEKFAELLGVTSQAVSKWENGKCLPETALLPALAALLDTSIDSILLPQELIILEALYTCGESYIVVTDTLNRAVESNRLIIKASCPIGGNSLEGPAVFILTVKYQTNEGVFYDFVPQNQTLELDLNSKGCVPQEDFKFIGAFYGREGKYNDALHKMHHYEYFNWKEIHVNHELFPSSIGIDEKEYLTLVYLNKNGIQVISCPENGVLQYTSDRTALLLKDTSSCILPDIMVLEWGVNNTMPCTWAGAIYASLKYMGKSYTYEQIMGMSGACYRITFCEVWDWSALDAVVAFSYDIPLYAAIGYKPVGAYRLEKEERNVERQKIMSDILQNKPIIAINLRVAAEWGVITGYSDNGKTLYCRTYFDGDKLNENKDYLESENWPFLIVHFGERTDKPSEIEVLHNSLKALIDSFTAPPNGGYFQGEQGYKKLMEGLLNDNIWNEKCPIDDLARRFDVHLSTVYQLIDARRCAAVFLKESCVFVDNKTAVLLKEMADRYVEFSNFLEVFKDGLLQEGINSFIGCDGINRRKKQVELLKKALEEELKNVEIAKRILD